MKPLSNISLFRNRIACIAKKPPQNPMRGNGYKRVECTMDTVFKLVERLAFNHTAVIMNREVINQYGKLGFANNCYVSPEIAEALEANKAELEAFEAASRTVAALGYKIVID